MKPQYVTKSLVGASSTGIGTISSASPAVTTLNTSQLDTARRISIFSASGTLAGFTFTIIGTQEGGTPVRETITGPTSNVPAATTQDFLSVSSILASCAPLTTLATFGTNTTGGTQWKPINTQLTPVQIGCYVTFSSTAAGMTASMEMTLDDPTGTFYAGSGGSGPLALGGTVAPGGQPIPYNAPPQIINCVSFSSVTSNTFGCLNLSTITSTTNQLTGVQVPAWGWRMTLTSSSTAAGISVNAAVIQAGIG